MQTSLNSETCHMSLTLNINHIFQDLVTIFGRAHCNISNNSTSKEAEIRNAGIFELIFDNVHKTSAAAL